MLMPIQLYAHVHKLHSSVNTSSIVLRQGSCNVWALVYGLCSYLDDNGRTLLPQQYRLKFALTITHHYMCS